jgi:hypothetical protein
VLTAFGLAAALIVFLPVVLVRKSDLAGVRAFRVDARGGVVAVAIVTELVNKINLINNINLTGHTPPPPQKNPKRAVDIF